MFFWLVIFTPLHYLLSQSDRGYVAFLGDLYWNKPPLATGHLWFVASLLVYSMVYVLVTSRQTRDSASEIHFKSWYPLLYLAFLVPVNVWVREVYPIDRWVTWGIPIEVAHLPQYFSLFWLGTVAQRHKWLP